MKKLLKYLIPLSLVFPLISYAVNITVPSAPGSGYYLVSTSTGAYVATTTPATSTSPWSVNGSNIYYNGGKVGIGTTTPFFNLDISTTSASIGNSKDSLLIQVIGQSGAGNPDIFLDPFGGITITAGGTGSVNIGQGTDQVITSSGSVLDAGNGDASFRGMLSGPVNTLDDGVGGATFGGGVHFSNAIKDLNNLAGNSNDILTSTGSNQVLWQSIASLGIVSSQWVTSGSTIHYNTGNVGIGSTTPIASLSIKGTGGTNPFIVASSSNAQMLTLLQNGNFGVSTSSPLANFSVAGNTINSNVLAVYGGTGPSGGNAQSVIINGGNANNSSNQGGSINLTGGNGSNFNAGSGGDINVTAGNGLGGGIGGNFIVNPGTGGAGGNIQLASLRGKVGISTTTPDSKLDVYGDVRFESASSSVITPSIGGAIVGLGCDSATTSVDTTLSSSTTAFITTPQNYPGDGLFWNTYLSATGVITTKVCSDVTVTPTASQYIVKIIK